MNTQLLKKFTPEILQGVEALGFISEAYSGVLSAKQAEMMEEKTGRTIGELALLGIEYKASPAKRDRQRELVHETIDLMTAFDSNPVIGRAR